MGWCPTSRSGGLRSRPIFLSSLKSTSGFWLGKVVDEDAVIDHTWVTADNVSVATYDASGTAGGAWFRSLRWFWPFLRSFAPGS